MFLRCKAMAMLKVLVLLLIILSTLVDARARRKRRQLSSSSYYISNINPYASSFNPAVPLTYPSGSYYSAPGYGYPNTGYSADRPYDSNYYGPALAPYGFEGPYIPSQSYLLPTVGSTYGSGTNVPYVPGLTGYAIPGFSNQNPNWNQGNSYQYYTGGTGTGLTNMGLNFYRSLRNTPVQGPIGQNPMGPNLPMGLNPTLNSNIPPGRNAPRPMRKSALISSSRQ